MSRSNHTAVGQAASGCLPNSVASNSSKASCSSRVWTAVALQQSLAHDLGLGRGRAGISKVPVNARKTTGTRCVKSHCSTRGAADTGKESQRAGQKMVSTRQLFSSTSQTRHRTVTVV